MVVERSTTDLVADMDVQNPTVNGTTVQSNPIANGAVENKVEPSVKVTKEVPKKTSVAVPPSPPAQKDNPPPAQKDIPKKTPVAASPPPSPAQKDVTKKTYASIVSYHFIFYLSVGFYCHVHNVIPK